jgi:hypothetical protein
MKRPLANRIKLGNNPKTGLKLRDDLFYCALN